MKKLLLASFMIAASASALAQSTTIYKHVDAQGRVTYSNKPIKDGVVVELEPLTTIPSTPMGMLQAQPGATASAAASSIVPIAESKPNLKPAVAIVTPLPATTVAAAFPSIDAQTQKRRDEGRRKILEDELDREEKELAEIRKSLRDEQQNPTLVAAVRMAQAAVDPTPSQQAEFRKNIDKASGRIRGLQATVAEHEKNIEALKKELGALKP